MIYGRIAEFALGLLISGAWTAVFVYFMYRWKTVCLLGRDLVVSDFLHKVTIPVAWVRTVEGSGFWSTKPKTMKLHFDRETEFGTKIVFIPVGAWVPFFSTKDAARGLEKEFQSLSEHAGGRRRR